MACCSCDSWEGDVLPSEVLWDPCGGLYKQGRGRGKGDTAS